MMPWEKYAQTDQASPDTSGDVAPWDKYKQQASQTSSLTSSVDTLPAASQDVSPWEKYKNQSPVAAPSILDQPQESINPAIPTLNAKPDSLSQIKTVPGSNGDGLSLQITPDIFATPQDKAFVNQTMDNGGAFGLWKTPQPVVDPIQESMRGLPTPIAQPQTKKVPEMLKSPQSQAADFLNIVQTPIWEYLPENAKSNIAAAMKFPGSHDAGAAGGILKGIGGVASSFTSPLGITTLAMGGLPKTIQRGVSLAFAYDMASKTPELARQLGEEMGKNPKDRSDSKIAQIITEGAANTIFAALAASHGLAPGQPNPIHMTYEQKVKFVQDNIGRMLQGKSVAELPDIKQFGIETTAGFFQQSPAGKERPSITRIFDRPEPKSKLAADVAATGADITKPLQEVAKPSQAPGLPQEKVPSTGALLKDLTPEQRAKSDAVKGSDVMRANMEQLKRQQAELDAKKAQAVGLSESVQSFSKNVDSPDAKFGNKVSTETGMGVKSVSDLEKLAELKKRFDDETRKLNKELQDAPKEKQMDAFVAAQRAGQKTQLAREAIEVATDTGSWIEAESRPEFGKIGERPLDWRKNPEVADWLSKNAADLGIKLPKDFSVSQKVSSQDFTKNLPPVNPGFKRVYRGQEGAGGSGAHWTESPEYAVSQGKNLQYLDVPENQLSNYQRGTVAGGKPKYVIDDELAQHVRNVESPVDPKVQDLTPGETVPPVQPSSAGKKPKLATETAGEAEFARAQTRNDPFERARTGDDSAFDELDAQFREIYPDPIDFGRPGSYDPKTVHTPQAFAALFNKAFAARDFDTILDAIKATSDVSIWKPFLREQFKAQATDPIAAQKAEWMRHVFNGTRPPEAVPRPEPKPSTPRTPPPVTPKPRGKAGTPPPPRPPPTPPSPPPARIPVDPIPGGGGKSPFRILEDFSKAIGKAIRVLRMKKNGLGVYRPGSTLTAERFAGDLDTAAHELAGHWTDDKYGIGKPWIAPKTRSPYDTELASFWIHGSVTPRSSLRYRRAEGIAEFIRAYVVNPKQAMLDAPKFGAYFEKSLPPEALKAIQDFSGDVRRWAGETPTTRAGLNIRMEPPTLTERLWKGITGRGFGFEINPIDRLRLWFDDPYHFAVKADKAIQQLRGGERLPQEQFELTARLLATHDSRMSDQFEHGLVPLRPGQAVNARGQMEVQRIIDPVTKKPASLEWVMGTFDTKNNDAFKQDMLDTSAYMVAERTIAKAKEFGREENISGIGAGMMSDVQAAKELLAEVAKDPAKEAKLKEGARRYRFFADNIFQWLVDSGRITKGQAKAIRDANEQYVNMHRLSEEFEVANYGLRGGGIGTTKDVIRRFKGSTLEIDNVYSSMLEQMDSIQKEASRNVVMNNFTDGLRNVRELHGPNLKDFDQFGRKVTSADKNTITIYKNGKAEHWQFAPEIHEALKGLGELQSNALFNIITLPSKFARYMITRGPSFMIRNPLRDTFERSVNSRSAAKPWDIFQGYSQAELSRYETFGGGQFGNYIVDRHVWHRELKRVMRELTKDKSNILLSPLKLKHAWEALGEKSEKLGRIAEFRRAFDEKRKSLAVDNPSLTPQEIDYNAALYAAGEARGLLDFAKAGTVMKHVNRAIPFSNAAMRGLGKSIQGMRENPGRYAMKWGLYVLAPTLAVMAWNRRDEETWNEYEQLPAYRRDLFWNMKVGNHWLIIPKPHLLGVLAGGVERIISGILGTPHSMEGLSKSAANALPVSNLTETTGPLKTFLELEFNRDTFRNRDIIPSWERDLSLDLRKGTAYASGAGKLGANILNLAGLGIDPRQVDHVLNSVGGWGTLATSATRSNARSLGQTLLQSSGLFVDTPGTNAKDVQWVLDWAKQNGKTSTTEMKAFQDMRKSVFEQKDSNGRAKASTLLRNRATELRAIIESRVASPQPFIPR